MPTPTKGARFGGSPAHQRLILANLAQALFEHGRITTTEAKARRLRPYAEQLITKAKTDTVANRRRVVRVIRDQDVLHTLFTEIGPAMATRPGGYTRITKIGPRKGDNAPMAVIEIVEAKEFAAQNQTPKKPKTVKATAAPAAEPVEDAAVEVEDAAVEDAAVETEPEAPSDVEETVEAEPAAAADDAVVTEDAPEEATETEATEIEAEPDSDK